MHVNCHLDSTHITRNARGAAGHSSRCWARSTCSCRCEILFFFFFSLFFWVYFNSENRKSIYFYFPFPKRKRDVRDDNQVDRPPLPRSQEAGTSFLKYKPLVLLQPFFDFHKSQTPTLTLSLITSPSNPRDKEGRLSETQPPLPLLPRILSTRLLDSSPRSLVSLLGTS